MGLVRRRLTREESKQRTRERLLDAAEGVFARLGFCEASVELVAEEAGFSKGAVYANFESKDDLFLAVFDRRIERGLPTWERVFGGDETGENLASEVEGALLEGSLDIAWTLLELEFFMYAMRHERARVKLAERYRGIRARIMEAVGEHFIKAKITPPMPIEELSWVLFGLAMGLTIQEYADRAAVPTKLRTTAIAPLLGSSDCIDRDAT